MSIKFVITFSSHICKNVITYKRAVFVQMKLLWKLTKSDKIVMKKWYPIKDFFFIPLTFSSLFCHKLVKMYLAWISSNTYLLLCCKIVTKKYFKGKRLAEVKIQQCLLNREEWLFKKRKKKSKHVIVSSIVSWGKN